MGIREDVFIAAGIQRKEYENLLENFDDNLLVSMLDGQPAEQGFKSRRKHVFNQSISQNVYSTPSTYLLRSAPDPGQAEKNSLEKVVELRTGTVWEVP